MKVVEELKNIIKSTIDSVTRTIAFIVRFMINAIISIRDFVVRFISTIIIWLFLAILSLGAVTYFVNVPIKYDTNMMAEYKDYIVNKRSLKIHIESCHSVSKMSERNKLKVHNSLDNLTKDGYIVCKRCKAGIKRQNEFIASTLEGIENLLFGNEDVSLESSDKFLASIEEMGKWYVDHVATYETEFDDKATENAKKYYKSIKLDKRGNIYLYPCENLRNCVGEYTKAGDDCVRFVFSCLNNMDKNFINLLSKNSKYKWSSINSNILNERHNQLQYTLSNMGFEIYDLNPQKVDLNKDGYFEFEIFPIDKSFKLQKGDILSRDGHIHIYLNENENFGWGKVNNVYPQNTLTYIDPATNNIICSGSAFDRVYRYIGEN